MLNYRFAMRSRHWFSPLILVGIAFLWSRTWSISLAQQEASPTISIQSPLPGQAVQGVVSVIVNMPVEGVHSVELYFAYSNNPTATWFLINQASVSGTGALTDWDTTLITDGNYDLWLVVTLQDMSKVDAFVRGVRVRNYSPVETDTPTPILPTFTPIPGDTLVPTTTPTPTITLTPTVTLTPTLLPTNPAEIPPDRIFTNLGMGGLVVSGIFLGLGLYLWARNLIRKRATL